MKFMDDSSCSQGVVYQRTSGCYIVHSQGRSISCSLAARLRISAHTGAPDAWEELPYNPHVSPVAIGDEVYFRENGSANGQITAILARRNRLSRRSAVPMPGAHAFEQIIVANLDQVLPVFAAANPQPKWNMLDRYLVSAESQDLPARICITKLDLAQDENGRVDAELLEVVERYRSIGYPVILVSVVTGEGLAEVRDALQGRTSVLVGKSGVGKSSLLNALQPGLGLRVGAVSQQTGKGKHVTTGLQMFPLDFGGAIVDTPGVREFGLWETAEDDLAMYFPEMRPFVGCCKFGLDCSHNEEPGCAVRRAVNAGQISPYRYQSYLRLRDD